MPYIHYPNVQNQINWGSIGGNIANQSDLQATLDSKSDIQHSHDTLPDYFTKSFIFDKFGEVVIGTYTSPISIECPLGWRTTIKSMFCRLTQGSLTCGLKRNGTFVSGFDNIQISTTRAKLVPTNELKLSDNDLIELDISSIADSPLNLYFQLDIKYEKIV